MSTVSWGLVLGDTDIEESTAYPVEMIATTISGGVVRGQMKVDLVQPGGTYHREHKPGPSKHADFAWPNQHKAIEVWGGVHILDHFVRQERVPEANQRQIDRAKAAGWQLMIVTDEDLRRDNRDQTRERVRGSLG